MPVSGIPEILQGGELEEFVENAVIAFSLGEEWKIYSLDVMITSKWQKIGHT